MSEKFEFDEPTTSLVESAIILHELYMSLLDAGFSQEESLILVGNMVVGWSKKMED